jgi:hypothetical protein
MSGRCWWETPTRKVAMQIVITAAELLEDDQIMDKLGAVVTSVTTLENGRIQFKLDDGSGKYTLDAEGIMEVWRNPRNADAIDVDDAQLIGDAITHGAITGAVGGSMSVQDVDRSVRFAKVDRIAKHAAGWRVREHHNPELVGKVFVRAGLPGRYATHAR